MEAWADTVFYLVFAGQIYTISFHFPRAILARMERVVQDYPPTTHPLLYPRPAAYYEIGRSAFRWSNYAIGVLGIAVMFAIHRLDGGHISEAWPAAYAMLQFIPFMVLAFRELGQLKLMRVGATSRRATLERRSLGSLFPPVLTGAALLAFAGAVALETYANGFQVDWGKVAALSLGNVFMAASLAVNILRGKRDPHQAGGDRHRALKATAISSLCISIAISLFFMWKTAEDLYGIDYLDAIAMSLYFQAINWLGIGMVLHALRLEEIDFDVYRNGSLST